MIAESVPFGSIMRFSHRGFPSDSNLGMLTKVNADEYIITCFDGGNRWVAPRRFSLNELDRLSVQKLEAEQNINVIEFWNPDSSVFSKLFSSKEVQQKKSVVQKELTLTGLLKKINGKIFTICFIKADGTKRVMNCRTGVSRYVKGTKKSPPSHEVVTVYDLALKEYRSFNKNRVCWVRFAGETYEF